MYNNCRLYSEHCKCYVGETLYSNLFLQRIKYLFHQIVNLIGLKMQPVSPEVAQMSVHVLCPHKKYFQSCMFQVLDRDLIVFMHRA